MNTLDPHQRPPEEMRNVYKKYQKMKLSDLSQDREIVDLENGPSDLHKSNVSIIEELDPESLSNGFRGFAGRSAGFEDFTSPKPVYEHSDMPGLHIIPSLLPPEVQTLLLSHLLHRDLSNPAHLTNIHTHYTLSYPPPLSSFFTHSPTSPVPTATPLDPSIHKPLTTAQLLNKKLRWITLGGQYDWTAKEYPATPPPPFPTDIKQLLSSLFPSTVSEAAIVNLYSPGDTLSLHRDVAESCDTGLISISLGCDAIFIIGTAESTNTNEDEDGHGDGIGQGRTEEKVLALRLKSGSAVYMSGPSRFAWHGVPQIVKDTCPAYLRDWPAGEEGSHEFEEWRGWMAGKRVNVNVRQMW